MAEENKNPEVETTETVVAPAEKSAKQENPEKFLKSSTGIVMRKELKK